MTDLSIIFKHEGTELKVDTSLPVDSFEFNGETYSLDGPILVKGLFRNIGFHKISTIKFHSFPHSLLNFLEYTKWHVYLNYLFFI